MRIQKTIAIILSLVFICLLSAGCSFTSGNEASPVGSDQLPQKRQDILIPIAKGLVEDMSKGNWQKAYDTFDTNMCKAMPVDKLPSVWQSGTKIAGDFGSVGEATAVMLKGYETVIVQCPSKKANLLVKVIFTKSNKVTGLWFDVAPHGAAQVLPSFTNTATPIPTTAVPVPDTIAEEQVTVGKGGQWPLPGTLTLPKDAKGPLPAVVLVPGSGASDRDETVPTGGKPFRDIAWGLAQRGIAVLRYDKRTFTYGNKMAPQAADLTVKEEFIEDAVAAASLLRQDNHIDPSHIYLVAHSEGAMLAPRIEMSGGGFTGLVLLAGSPRKLWEIQYDQNMALIQNGGGSQEDIAKVEAEKTNGEKLFYISADEAKKMTVFSLPGYYQWEMQQYNAGDIAQGISKPMLILQGEKDIQVSPEKDFGSWKQALAGKTNVTFKLYPGLTHFLSEDDGTFSLQNPLGTKPIVVSDTVIADIAAWIQYGKLDQIPAQ